MRVRVPFLLAATILAKTTLLDMVARALWSLPATHENESYRSFNTSWYRRVDKTFARPKVTVILPDCFLHDSVCASPEAELVFELWGDIAASRVLVDSAIDVRLVSTNCDVVLGEARAGVRPVGGSELEITIARPVGHDANHLGEVLRTRSRIGSEGVMVGLRE